MYWNAPALLNPTAEDYRYDYYSIRENDKSTRTPEMKVRPVQGWSILGKSKKSSFPAKWALPYATTDLLLSFSSFLSLPFTSKRLTLHLLRPY